MTAFLSLIDCQEQFPPHNMMIKLHISDRRTFRKRTDFVRGWVTGKFVDDGHQGVLQAVWRCWICCIREWTKQGRNSVGDRALNVLGLWFVLSPHSPSFQFRRWGEWRTKSVGKGRWRWNGWKSDFPRKRADRKGEPLFSKQLLVSHWAHFKMQKISFSGVSCVFIRLWKVLCVVAYKSTIE